MKTEDACMDRTECYPKFRKSGKFLGCKLFESCKKVKDEAICEKFEPLCKKKFKKGVFKKCATGKKRN